MDRRRLLIFCQIVTLLVGIFIRVQCESQIITALIMDCGWLRLMVSEGASRVCLWQRFVFIYFYAFIHSNGRLELLSWVVSEASKVVGSGAKLI